MRFHTLLMAAAVSAALLSACSSNDSVVNIPTPSAGDRRLKTFEDSTQFFAALKQALVSQLERQTGGLGVPENGTDGLAPPDAEDSTAASDGGGGESDQAGGSASGNEITSTNVQEQGVDEQDWVKLSNDGSTLYVVDTSYGSFYPGEPVPEGIDTPAIEPAGDEPLGTSFPAPQPNQTTLRVMSLDAETPDSSTLQELEINMGSRSTEGAYLYESGSSASLFLTASGSNFWPYWADSYAFVGQDSLITRVDVSSPGAAAITGKFQLDGQIVSSRRIGKHLFFASRFYPSLPGEQPWNKTAEQIRAQLENTDLSTLLPQFTVGESSESAPLIDASNCFVAPQQNENSYYTPDIITLGVIDLDTLQLTDSECYLGASETLYASPEAVFLATTQYDYPVQPVAANGVAIDVENGEFPSDDIWLDPRVDTDIHQFDIDAGQLVYAGSGSVKGHLGWNPLRKPFRMSERAGYLRVATFNDRQGTNDSPILLAVLQADGTGSLKTVATLPNANEPGFIGKPGEQLYASRFLGDRAYLVTFRQTDPLYVIDLSNPQAPRVAGELEIEGYSDYLHPVGDDYLLGIGKDAVASPDFGWGDGRGALVQGVKLSLFNVSNLAQPTEVQSVVIGQRGTHSQALDDHRAVTVQAATEQHPLRVSIGIDVYGQSTPTVPTPIDTAFDYYPWSYSGLHGFDINVGADAGIVPRGALVAESAADGNNYYYGNYGRDRSVMVNDSVFYIRGSSVYAANWNDLANPSPAR